jgi:polar amino acid transport system substrate-binding protein
MKFRITALLCGALAAASCTAPASAATDRLTWGWFNAAPYMIAAGPDKGQGIFDQIRTLLKDEMPEYEHKDVQAPFPRILREISNGNPWCFVGGVKSPEREALYYFSAPVAVFLPFKVVVRRDRLAEFGGGSSGTVSLAELLNKPAMRSSFLRGRTFTPSINTLLQQAHLADTRQYHSEFNEALQMLLAGRLDYLIELPIISTYSARQLGRDGELAALAIREHAEPTMNRVMCPRTEWGKQVVRRVDTVLHAQRAGARYRAIVERWSDDESVRAIRALYPTHFLKTE